MNIVGAVYSHPEYYPPTLNALNELAAIAGSVTILGRNVYKSEWQYPDNVKLEVSGKFKGIAECQNASGIWKLFSFLRFTVKLYVLIRKTKPKWVICYDPIPLFSFHLTRFFLFDKPKVWYHNHDVIEGIQPKYSITGMAADAEKKAFKYIDLFSLPADERKKYFNLNEFGGKYFFIPNYPSKKLYNRYYTEKKIKKDAVLIYQGTITESHGLELITTLLNDNVKGINLTLNLKGILAAGFREKILDTATSSGTTGKVNFLGMTSYIDVPIQGNKAHIGIGIFTKNDIMNNTLGTASNKLFEYAAMGLPVLYYDNDHFNEHLGDFTWAVKCKVNKDSILGAITFIVDNYKDLSGQAHDDFNKMLNFEKYFEPVIKFISEN